MKLSKPKGDPLVLGCLAALGAAGYFLYDRFCKSGKKEKTEESRENGKETVFVLMCQRLFTGCRIEGFQGQIRIFKERQRALDAAFELATSCANSNALPVRNETGEYVGEASGGYEEWPDFRISVSEAVLDLSAESGEIATFEYHDGGFGPVF
uniref:Uncharacterized protein n=1 Tax=Chromera velia CCMP2878 TaxID=1169474 RepID=A0A0G4FGI0_9ALVE|eukprot:Cvel_3279.t1-p1 / transcript=Cvel_3279.t1 / gene=Cvel_3279 / organism=Chromera_velia_CCMP2878 / gene_product=hypothetical protein / transcript_product=hypothetical protein / location=Cvel_scaffold129:12399-12854(+) / protein_length=152 / sequence_SO=supercontig / SO=protein_coding / is_pseudo=false